MGVGGVGVGVGYEWALERWGMSGRVDMRNGLCMCTSNETLYMYIHTIHLYDHSPQCYR